MFYSILFYIAVLFISHLQGQLLLELGHLDLAAFCVR